MITEKDNKCPNCGSPYLIRYDRVWRIIINEYGIKNKIRIDRYQCKTCGTTHRLLLDYMFPYKQYRKDIILGVVEGTITSYAIEFEDYPSDKTKRRWVTEFHSG